MRWYVQRMLPYGTVISYHANDFFTQRCIFSLKGLCVKIDLITFEILVWLDSTVVCSLKAYVIAPPTALGHFRAF